MKAMNMRCPIIRIVFLALTMSFGVQATTTAQSIDREAVWDKNWRSVVRLEVTGKNANGVAERVRTGSGVIVRSNGTIVTALHVVGRDEDWEELPGGLRDRKVKVIGLNDNRIEQVLGEASVRPMPSSDIAILNITAEGLSEASVAEVRPRDLASVVAILWGPDEHQPQPVSGDLLPTDRGRHGDLLTVQMAVSPGHSGSGVFGADRTLVGIVTNELPSAGGFSWRALAVPADAFLPFLPPKPTSPSEKVAESKSIRLSNIASRIGENRWQWTAFVEAKPNVVNQIECVEYILHPTFANPRVDVCTLGDDDKPFSLSAQGWGVFNLKARVLFNDGTYQEIERFLKF